MRAINPLGILSSDVAIGNLVWVDQINGNDTLAVRGRMTIPFQSLGAAKDAAQSGDTITVMPGNYSEKNLLKNGVSWFFLPGAVVNYAGGAAGAIFDTSAAYGSNGVVNCFIAGYGVFILTTANAGTSNVLYCDNGSSISIQARSLQSTNATIKVTAGACQVQVIEDVICPASDAVSVSGGTLTVYARDIITSGGCCLRVPSGSGTVDIFGRKLSSSTDHGVSIESTSSGTATIRAYEILASSSNKYAVYCNNTGGEVLTIIGARLKTSWSGTGSYAVKFGTASSDKLKLANCVLIAGPSAMYSMDSTNNGAVVDILNGVTANVAYHAAGNISLVPSTAAFLVGAIT